MLALPYVIPDKNLNLNLGLMLLIIKHLGKTNRGKLLINNDKAHAYLYLLKNPTYLNRVLKYFDKPTVGLTYSDSFSIMSMSPDLEPLFDRDSLKEMLLILISKKFVTVNYRNKEGFFYSLSEQGNSKASNLCGNYYETVTSYLLSLKEIQSESANRLNIAINFVLRNGDL